ncbi:MAG: hypothetical protein JNL67_21845 [Planctomycetaceae bacterium]|nr:hypothetical protein [Planctomycetaceae bacterium]
MKTRFIVVSAEQVPGTQVFAVDGRLVCGRIRSGDVWYDQKDRTKFVKIRSMALGTSVKKIKDGILALSVEEPSFPIIEIVGSEMVSDDFTASTDDSQTNETG